MRNHRDTAPEMESLERTEVALADAIALISVQIDEDDAATRRELRRIVEARNSENDPERIRRISRTLDMTSLLASTSVDLAARLISDHDVTARALLSMYALSIAAHEERRRAIACRVVGPNVRSRSCPLCRCAKSGSVEDPNRARRSCPDRCCVCHTYDDREVRP